MFDYIKIDFSEDAQTGFKRIISRIIPRSIKQWIIYTEKRIKVDIDYIGEFSGGIFRMPFILEDMPQVTEKTFKKLINYIYKSVDAGKCGISMNPEMKMYFDIIYKDYRKEFYVCIIDELIRRIVEDKKLIKAETAITIIDGEEKEEDTRKVLVTLGE